VIFLSGFRFGIPFSNEINKGEPKYQPSVRAGKFGRNYKKYMSKSPTKTGRIEQVSPLEYFCKGESAGYLSFWMRLPCYL
jgi:hypothetical protein